MGSQAPIFPFLGDGVFAGVTNLSACSFVASSYGRYFHAGLARRLDRQVRSRLDLQWSISLSYSSFLLSVLGNQRLAAWLEGQHQSLPSPAADNGRQWTTSEAVTMRSTKGISETFLFPSYAPPLFALQSIAAHCGRAAEPCFASFPPVLGCPAPSHHFLVLISLVCPPLPPVEIWHTSPVCLFSLENVHRGSDND